MRTTGAGSWIRPEKRLAIYIRDGFACAYCGSDLRDRDPREMGLDHLDCSSHGGSNHETNLVLACRSCNSSRGTRPWRTYATGGAVERIERQRVLPLNMKLAKAVMKGEATWTDR
jgi:5-methylcytosine-specific restriction endonuclease McrA